MSKHRKTRQKDQDKTKEWPAVVYFSMIGTAFAFYAVARVALNDLPHPYHWGSGLAGIGVGLILGWVYYRWKGDIV